jgi:serine/threonine protein kinase
MREKEQQQRRMNVTIVVVVVVLYRDLATRNVLLREGSHQCVVADFGLSRKVEGDDGAKTKTVVGPLVSFCRLFCSPLFLTLICFHFFCRNG